MHSSEQKVVLFVFSGQPAGLKAGLMVQMQAVQVRLTGAQEASGGAAPQSPNPRILVLRESGDVEVNVDLGDHENTPDGSFVRTVTHRHFSSGDEHQDERVLKAQSKGEHCVLPCHAALPKQCNLYWLYFVLAALAGSRSARQGTVCQTVQSHASLYEQDSGCSFLV